MKTLKMIQAALAITALSILVGCSDQITSSGETGSSKKDEGVILERIIDQETKDVEYSKSSLILKPNSSFKFNLGSTGWAKFFSIDIFDRNEASPNAFADLDICSKVKVYTNTRSGLTGCHSSGFEVSEITIENISSSAVNIEVALTGMKQKKNVRYPENNN